MSDTAEIELLVPADSTPGEMDHELARLQEGAKAFASLPISNRLHLIEQGMAGVSAVAERWVRLACKAKGLDFDGSASAEEWFGGPMTTLRNLRLLKEALLEIRELGKPRLNENSVSSTADGRAVVRVFPRDIFDKAMYAGFVADVWMQDGVTEETVEDTMAESYRDGGSTSSVTLVLGAGNVASIGPMDVMHQLFVDNSVCLLKLNPVNAYLGPVLEDAFSAWIESGFMGVCYGGADIGEYLCQHPHVDRIHITGSDRTHDAIVWGPASEQADRKARGDRHNEKPITSELGNVSPVIVVPGQWTAADLQFQAENVATMIVNNGSFNCNAAKLLIMQAGWAQKEQFLDRLRKVLAGIPPRRAYYPGAAYRYEKLTGNRKSIETIGEPAAGALPWTFILDVDSNNVDDDVFHTEPFCSVLSVTTIEAADTPEFLKKTTDFCNDVVWGTLNACLIAHPKTLKDAVIAEAFEKAVGDLKYGTVAVNHWPALGYGLTLPPWGAYPGHALEDIQSGRGVVHNTLMFSKTLKTVVRGPFRVFPKPPWFVTHKRAHRVAQHLTRFERQPSALKLPSVIFHALLG